MSQNSEVHKSLLTRALVAFCGALLALALGVQYQLGAWGLVLTIFPTSCAGWILVDLAGFVVSLKKGLEQARDILLEDLPLALGRLGKSVRRIWRRHVDYIQETGATLCLLVGAPIILALLTVILLLILEPAKQGVFPIVASLAKLALSLMLLFIACFFFCLFYGLADVKRMERATLLARILGNAGGWHKRKRLIQNNYPEIWERASAEAKIWSCQFFLKWNLVCLPFTLAIFALKGLWWVLAGTPRAIWESAKILYLVCVSIAKMLSEIIPAIYYHANSDKRRMAFSSIALGMTMGFLFGYQFRQTLLGAIASGGLTYVIGLAQHYWVYPKLIARRAQVPV